MENSDQLLVGNMVRDLRGVQTQAEFAKRYGRQRNSVSYWERGTPSYSAQLVLDIVQYYSARGVEAFAERIKAIAEERQVRARNGRAVDSYDCKVYALSQYDVDTELARYKEGEATDA